MIRLYPLNLWLNIKRVCQLTQQLHSIKLDILFSHLIFKFQVLFYINIYHMQVKKTACLYDGKLTFSLKKLTIFDPVSAILFWPSATQLCFVINSNWTLASPLLYMYLAKASQSVTPLQPLGRRKQPTVFPHKFSYKRILTHKNNNEEYLQTKQDYSRKANCKIRKCLQSTMKAIIFLNFTKFSWKYDSSQVKRNLINL